MLYSKSYRNMVKLVADELQGLNYNVKTDAKIKEFFADILITDLRGQAVAVIEYKTIPISLEDVLKVYKLLKYSGAKIAMICSAEKATASAKKITKKLKVIICKPDELRKRLKEEAYERIFSWHRKNSKMIRKVYGRKDVYSDAYLKLVKLLPSPKRATDEDMLFVAKQVKTMLMEWAYHQKDEYGGKMLEYAEIIQKELAGKKIDEKKSKLYNVLLEYESKKIRS